MDGHQLFVGVNSLRFGPDGYLWAVDRGGPGIGKPLVPSGPKLMKINVSTNKVERIYDLASVTRPWSFVDDVRFHGSIAYLTDAGSPGLIVLDLNSGHGRRVLDGHPSTVAQTPLVAEGKVLRDPKGKPVNIHADQLEVSPDGEWLYYQASSGSLWRIGTKFLDDPLLTNVQLNSHAKPFADTPSTGGTAIAARWDDLSQRCRQEAHPDDFSRRQDFDAHRGPAPDLGGRHVDRRCGATCSCRLRNLTGLPVSMAASMLLNNRSPCTG